MKFGKLVGGGLGWAFGGPLGAILGYAVGSMFDRMGEDPNNPGAGAPRTGSADFGAALLVLSAAVMKANGKIKKSELDYIKNYYTKQFGEAKAQQYILTLREILKKEIPLRNVCLQIVNYMPHAMRLQLIHYLFGIARADGHVDSNEVNTVQTIANYLNVSSKDFDSIITTTRADPNYPLQSIIYKLFYVFFGFKDFDIFLSSDRIQPCPKIFLGRGSCAAIKKAGQ